MRTQQKITPTQAKQLKAVIVAGKSILEDLDGRSVNALERRGLVKVTENKKGTFVAPTAKGKKILN
jgi:hypothetical protein